LTKKLLTIEDIQFLTPKAFAILVQDVDIEDIGLLLRIGSDNLKDYVLKNVSKKIKAEILEVYNGAPKRVSEVELSAEKVLKTLFLLMEKEGFNINEDDILI